MGLELYLVLSWACAIEQRRWARVPDSIAVYVVWAPLAVSLLVLLAAPVYRYAPASVALLALAFFITLAHEGMLSAMDVLKVGQSTAYVPALTWHRQAVKTPCMWVAAVWRSIARVAGPSRHCHLHCRTAQRTDSAKAADEHAPVLSTDHDGHACKSL